MSENYTQNAVDWLSEHIAFTKWCWCGNSLGHLPAGSKCHHCGQPFDTQRLTRFELVKRLLRRPINVKLKAGRDRALMTNLYGQWRYSCSWPNKPEWDEMKREHFVEAFNRLNP